MPKKAVDIESGTVTFTFEDETSQTFELSRAEAVVRHLALHGASQKIGDSYAGAGDEENPLAYAKAAVADLIARLYAGEWKQSGGGGAKAMPVIVQAFAAVSGKSLEEAFEVYDCLTDDEKKALAKKPRIAAKVAAIKLERAAAKAAKLAKIAEESGE
jgi:hypothetical protein